MLVHAELTERIIGAAIAVHTVLGPGFLESFYEEALAVELDHSGLKYRRQWPVPVHYRGKRIGEHRLDFLVEDLVVVELKAVHVLENIFFAVVRSYLKATQLEPGLLFNFATMPVTVKRVGRKESARVGFPPGDEAPL